MIKQELVLIIAKAALGLFLHEPEQAAAFNYTLLRKELRAGSEVRVKTAKAIVR